MGKSTGSLRTFAKNNGLRVTVLPANRAGDYGRYQITGTTPATRNTKMRAKTVSSARRLIQSQIKFKRDYDAKLRARGLR